MDENTLITLKLRLPNVLKFRPNTADKDVVFDELVGKDMFCLQQMKEFEKYNNFIAIDAGAHIGIFSRYFAELFQNSQVYSFEPNPDSYQLLETNTKKFYERVTIYNQGVGLEIGQIKLYPSKNKYDTGSWSMVPSDSHDLNAGIDVAIINIEDFIKKIYDTDKKILLKIDLEGYEAEILNNINAEILKKIDWLIIEEHHIPIKHNRIKEAGFIEMFNPFASNRHFMYYNSKDISDYEKELICFSHINTKKFWSEKYDQLYKNRKLTLRNLLSVITQKIGSIFKYQ